MWDDRHYRPTSKPDLADGIRVYARALSGFRSSSDNVLNHHVAHPTRTRDKARYSRNSGSKAEVDFGWATFEVSVWRLQG
jgi:hypothetical protein